MKVLKSDLRSVPLDSPSENLGNVDTSADAGDGDGMGVQPVAASFVASLMATLFESCEKTKASDMDELPARESCGSS